MTVLKFLRQVSGLTLDHISEKGVSKWTYTFIENGSYKSSIKTRKKISIIFGLDMKYLFDKKGFAIAITMKEAKRLVKKIKSERSYKCG